MNKRPARIISVIVGIITTLLTLAVSLGWVPLTPGSAASILASITAIGAIVQGLWTEAKVVSPASAKELLQAPASDADPMSVLQEAQEFGTTAGQVVAARGIEK